MPGSRVELEFSGPAGPECLDQIHNLLAQLWQQHPGVSELDQMMFTTAILEVGSNILTHGTPTTVSVVVVGDAHGLEARLTDDGDAAHADPNAAVLPGELSESGRGLAIVRVAVDEVSHTYLDGRNHWHLLRRRGNGAG